jgi:hypothetical protein
MTRAVRKSQPHYLRTNLEAFASTTHGNTRTTTLTQKKGIFESSCEKIRKAAQPSYQGHSGVHPVKFLHLEALAGNPILMNPHHKR